MNKEQLVFLVRGTCSVEVARKHRIGEKRKQSVEEQRG